jgi:hypothetical protein
MGRVDKATVAKTEGDEEKEKEQALIAVIYLPPPSHVLELMLLSIRPTARFYHPWSKCEVFGRWRCARPHPSSSRGFSLPPSQELAKTVLSRRAKIYYSGGSDDEQCALKVPLSVSF